MDADVTRSERRDSVGSAPPTKQGRSPCPCRAPQHPVHRTHGRHLHDHGRVSVLREPPAPRGLGPCSLAVGHPGPHRVPLGSVHRPGDGADTTTYLCDRAGAHWVVAPRLPRVRDRASCPPPGSRDATPGTPPEPARAGCHDRDEGLGHRQGDRSARGPIVARGPTSQTRHHLMGRAGASSTTASLVGVSAYPRGVR